jgi:hypothetical protein
MWQVLPGLRRQIHLEGIFCIENETISQKHEAMMVMFRTLVQDKKDHYNYVLGRVGEPRDFSVARR